ncbi:MAG: bifunctional enoyl-CoA hydratase/phosphate acetyltransferase [Burkholderiaceae bacterium]|nr:bifunctional enoyl-CoA hydratase/phosphate acetyltransferase [Burkholderiaceae bacterium]
MDFIRNHPLTELRVGDHAQLVRALTVRDIELFAALSGDVNPLHLEHNFARSTPFHHVVAHGMWVGALVSMVLGTMLPGPGTIYRSQSLEFVHAVAPGDTLTVSVTVSEIDRERNHVTLDCAATNQDGVTVARGRAEVMAPLEPMMTQRVPAPELVMHDKSRRYRTLIDAAHQHAAVRTAVVHPVDTVSLQGAVEAAGAGLIVPILVGNRQRIEAAATESRISLAGIEIADAPHSHAAARIAVQMARDGRVQALMKGALHTDELMHEVVSKDNGLLTDRRISHVFVLDVPTYARPLFITDAAINVLPYLEAKRDIAQNAIDLAHALGIAEPRVALLSAVETVYPKVASTIDAAALCKMAERGQITGAILDGPMAFDLAVSPAAVQTKGFISKVAGRAEILLVPNLEAGNMLAKQLEYLAGAEIAGIALGARVPVILTSRADGELARLASCALAVMLIAAKPPGNLENET